MRFLYSTLLSALLQLARIQTDSVVEMLRELHPDLHFEIGKCCFFWFLLWCRLQLEPASYLYVQDVHTKYCQEEENLSRYLRAQSEFI